MDREALIAAIRTRQSFLCVGLDSDLEKLPSSFSKDAAGMLAFNKAIIAATKAYCVAYKPNTAFYEVLGKEGWAVLEETIAAIPDTHFIIADAKRGDIGNTSRQYAKAFFEGLQCDAVTVAPYMGEDSVAPFLQFPGKWAIVLALTSNAGSRDFQHLTDQKPFYQHVLAQSQQWGTPENLMYVVGATQAEALSTIRGIVPDHFLLVPGIGAQGGRLEDVARYGLNKDIGLLVNASRSILFASQDDDFQEAASHAAQEIQIKMRNLLEHHKLL